MSGHFFVPPSTKGQSGSEKLHELLNDERLYVPFQNDESEMTLIQKGAIVSVLLASKEMRRDLPYQHRTSCNLHLLSSEILIGYVFIDLPETHRRLSDFLNVCNNFFFIEVDGEDYFVNTKSIKMAIPSRQGDHQQIDSGADVPRNGAGGYP
jgi:hypothetical protein